jgi:hypothetical protein
MDEPDANRFKKLPEPVEPEDLVETVDVDPHAQLEAGPLQEAAWVIRTAAT